MKKILIVLLFTFFSMAKETVWLGRSVRGQLMGDAWTALSNNDEMTLFYNPASLGGNYSVNLHPLPAKMGVTNALDDLDRFDNFPADAAGIADRILGFPLYLELSSFPGLKMFHFGFNLFISQKTNMILKNSVHPILSVDYRYDRGFATGFAFNIIGGATGKGKIASGNRLSLGYGLHYIKREGLKNETDLMSTGLLTQISAGGSDINSLKDSLGYVRGKSFGHDVGLEFSTGTGSSEFIAGFSILDVGTTHFKKTTPSSEDVPQQDMYMNFGFAFKQDLTFLDYALSMDIKPINRGLPLARAASFGMKLGLPLITAYAGVGEGYLSYGLEFDIFLFTVVAGFSSVELGHEFRQDEGKRAFLYLSMFDGSFDLF
jgi:hypothetical protein